MRASLAAALLLLAAPAALSQQAPPVLPSAMLYDVQPLGQVARVELAPFDLAALAKEDADRDAQNLPYRFAVPHDVFLSPDVDGTWEALPDGRMLWRLVIAAPGSTSINLGFGEYQLPDGAALWVTSSDLTRRIRPFTSADNEAHGQLWTPVVLGDEVVIELSVRPQVAPEVKLTLTRIGQGYRGFGGPGISQDTASGSCNVDVVCPEGDDWQLEIPSVTALQINGFLNCSGSMLNDTSTSLTPWLLTANHCGVSAGAATTLVVYWNYENSFCRAPGSAASGGPGDGTFNQFNTGSVWRAAYSPSDFTLVELDDDPDPAFQLSWSGWDATGADATSAVGIHHPGVQEKRISFEFDPTTTTSYLGEPVPGDGTHVRITDWDLGTTEGGSSGSPLYNQDHRVIGQLHGGFASCSSQTSDWYGRLSVSWNGGGTPSSRLRDWLDAANTGLLFTDSVSLDTLCDTAGTADLTAGSYGCAGTAGIEVVDCDLDLDEFAIDTALVVVTSPSEPSGESVLLTETGPGTARFTGSLALGGGGSGVLSVSAGETITLTYVDADDGLGGINVVVTDTALIDCSAPAISNVASSAVLQVTANVGFDADEPVIGTVRYGLSCGNLDQSESSSTLGTSVLIGLSGLMDDTLYHYAVDATDEAGNVSTDDNGGACYTFLTRPARDYFTEEFVSDNDTSGSALLLEPAAGLDKYTGCRQAISALPTDPTGGSALSLSDDGSATVPVGGGQSVVLYGTPWTSFSVNANGNITFGVADGDYTETLDEHFDLPRIAGLYDDLNPTAGGSVSWKQLADRMAVTWAGVPEYSTTNDNTFQIEMFFDGRIRISWLTIAALDGIAGVSDGGGIKPDFIEDDLSAFESCGADCQADIGFGGPGTATLSLCGGDLSMGTSADLLLVGAPANGTAFLFAGASFSPTPLKGGQLVPVPWLLQSVQSIDGAGEVLLAGVPGGGGPFTLYVQYAYPDGAQAHGVGFSSAIQADFLP